MMKYLIIIFTFFGLTSCQAKDALYYRTHPVELQVALRDCPGKHPRDMTCDQLTDIGKRINSLAFELQGSPQAFGNKILMLQQQISAMQGQLKKGETNHELQAKLEVANQELVDRMSIVKWLESPES